MPPNTPPLPGQRPMIEALLNEQAQREARAKETGAQAELERERRLAEEAEARRQQQEFEQSPGNRAYEVGKIAAPALGGMYAGHKFAEGIEGRQQAMKPSMRESMGIGRRLGPYVGKSMTYMLPEAAFLRAMASGMEEGEGRDLLNAGSIGLAAAGATNLGEGVVKSLTSPDEEARRPSSMAQALAGDQARDITPPQTPTEGRTALPGPEAGEAPEERVRHAERARRAARAAGVSDAGRKADNIEAVRKAVTENEQARTAVARELGVSPGRNYLQRISRALDDLGPRGAALVAAMLGYDAIRGEAGAAEPGTGAQEEAGGSMAEALLGGGAAGGGAYGALKGIEKGAEGLGNLASRYAPGVARAAGRAFPPASAALTAYDLATMPQESVPEDVGRARHERAQGLVNPLGRGRNQQASPMARALAGQ